MGKGKAFTKTQTPDPVLNRIQDQLHEIMAPILANPANNLADWRLTEGTGVPGVATLLLQHRINSTWTTVMEFPVTIGTWTIGQFLTRNAAGVLSWGTPAGSGGGLPSGGSVGQSVVNTGSGTGAWDYPVPMITGFGRRTHYWSIMLTTDTNFHDSGTGGTPTHFGAFSPTQVYVTHNAGGKRAALQATGITAGNTNVLDGAVTNWTVDNRPRARALVQSPASLVNLRFGFDVTDAGLSVTAPANAASAIHYVRLVYDVSVSANWLLDSGDGTNRSYTDTGLAVVVSTDYYLDLDWSAGTTLTSRIYVGSPSATPTVTNKTTNLSTGATALTTEMFDAGVGGVATGFAWSGITWDAN